MSESGIAGKCGKSGMANDDPKYLTWLRKQPCCAPYVNNTPCPYVAEAHHPTGAGMSLRGSDRDAIPLCRRHHQAIHDFRAPFFGWDKYQRRTWHLQKAHEHRLRYEREPEFPVTGGEKPF
jgi:hypothetical protein